MKLFLKLLVLIGLLHSMLLQANAGSALILPSILGVLEIFIFPSWMLVIILFSICVLVDTMIFRGHIKRHKRWIIVSSIGCNIITAVVAGFMLFYFSLMLAFNLKYASVALLIILIILLLALVTLIDIVIQIIIFNLLFSITDLKKLFFKLFISGFLILASIVMIKIVLHI